MNKLTAGSNLIWESSRMILPEHKARIRAHDLTPAHVQKPDYLDDIMDDLNWKIQAAISTKENITVTHYHNRHIVINKGNDCKLKGSDAITLTENNEKTVISLKNIISVESS